MADIVLATVNAKWIHPSLALRLLKANLGELERRAELREFTLRQPLEEQAAALLEAGPRILGMSVSIWNHRAIMGLLENLQERWVQRPAIILGGPEVSFLPPDAELFRHADWVVQGEGEEAFRELCLGILGAGGLPREAAAGKFIRPKPVDLERLVPAYRLYTEEDLRRKLVYLEASRGCPFGCEFCLSAAAAGESRRVREFPLETVLSQVEELIRRGGGAFKFLDRTFNANIPRARRIMEFFLARLPPGPAKPPFSVHFELVPRNIPQDLRACLARFPPGSLRMELGIQTLNPRIAALIGRPADPEAELETLRFLMRHTRGILHVDLIAGLPGEGAASFAQGFDRLWTALRAPASSARSSLEIQLGVLKLLPGAPLARHTQAFGMRYAAAPPYEVLETAALPAADLDRIKNFARFWELIMNRGHFPDLAARLISPEQGAFHPFMALSDWLLRCFGRNWGIPRQELRSALETYAAGAAG
ncbi:MAG: DUF4080 domain-containing protein [Treponema sp.]|jgi:radical SAM superfamily enzyme YgiQ (UPF0313 family)|nr:DUF4080 domain-containing protein [Treponema sp.]